MKDNFKDQIHSLTHRIRTRVLRSAPLYGQHIYEVESGFTHILEREIKAAELRGAAFAVMVIDQMHLDQPEFSDDTDRTFSGVKNQIRSKFEQVTGVDPAPNYPVPVKDATLMSDYRVTHIKVGYADQPQLIAVRVK